MGENVRERDLSSNATSPKVMREDVRERDLSSNATSPKVMRENSAPVGRGQDFVLQGLGVHLFAFYEPYELMVGLFLPGHHTGVQNYIYTV